MSLCVLAVLAKRVQEYMYMIFSFFELTNPLAGQEITPANPNPGCVMTASVAQHLMVDLTA